MVEHSMKKKIAILGSTGSIGTQALEVIDNLKIEYMTCVDDALKIMEVNDD